MTPPPASAQTPVFPPPRDPRTEGFTPLKYINDIPDAPGPACPQTVDPEFHPLRPYPASPCDPLIPRQDPEAPADPDKLYLTFSCANSLNTHGTYTVLDVVPRNLIGQSFNECSANLENSFGDTFAYQNYYLCGNQVCLVHSVSFHTAVNLTASKFPFIGNTQNAFDDQLKVNQYLNWYLAGTVQSSDQIPLDPNIDADMTRLTVFSGPVKKLLSQSAQVHLRTTLINGPIEEQYHNYIVGCKESRTIPQIVNAVLTCLKASASNILSIPRLLYLAGRIVVQGLIQVIQAIPRLAAADFSDPAALVQALIREGLTILANDAQFIEDFLTLGYQIVQNTNSCLSAIILDEAIKCSAPGATLIRLDGVDLNSALANQIPFSSLEDITSESTISFIPSIQPTTAGNIINSCPGRNPALIIDNAGELSDSRLYFPGLRSSNALTDLIQSVNLPHPPPPPPALSPKDEELVSQEINKHQGID